MTEPYLLSSSTVVPASPDAAFDAVLGAPLEDLFAERAGLIPAVRECQGQEGAWGTVGQTRTIVLADGSTNLETLVAADRPGNYRYQISEISGPLNALVAGIDGQFSIAPEGTGSRVTWSWWLMPTNAVTRLFIPVLAFFWRQYAAKMWPRYAARLATGAN
jgi:hypothetical protein